MKNRAKRRRKVKGKGRERGVRERGVVKGKEYKCGKGDTRINARNKESLKVRKNEEIRKERPGKA